ncbi:SAC3/GANP family protein, putative [Babesia caballi]|uniref:SAC3/GANP family protein, putative n=1 Tax=Babesia caballi TaxID=5871 RepID=A0AAV4LMH6_BABCB|nr:SAC3/GANP family protein, putative [Babesia caballi]
MACNPPDYLSIPGGDGAGPASRTLGNPLLRPLEGNEVGRALLKHQEVASFLRGTHTGRMVGEVLAMCPPKEIKQKLEMNTASDLERISSFRVNPRLALKSFQRSDASRVFKPEETRPAVWCRRTVFNILCYFVDADLVRKPYLMPKSFSYLDVYNFLRDRLRSIWQDLTVQHCTKHRAYIECFEISIRFLIYSNELLCENEEFDIAQNRGLLNTCLDKLMEGYEAVHKYTSLRHSKRQMNLQRNNNPNLDEVLDVLVYRSPHEAEFWGYRLLMHIPQLLLPGGSATFCDILQRMPEPLRASQQVKFAVEVCHNAASGNLYRYFTLMRHDSCPPLYAALMSRFAICLRVQFLETLVVRKIAKRGVNPLDMDTFNSMFGFEGESPSNAEKMLKKYDVSIYSVGDKQFLAFDEANAKQLTYDSAALQKLTNKFQTSSTVVRTKLESFASRQLIFDPDFEYPAGTGPDTAGTPFLENEPLPIDEPPASASPKPGIFGGGTFQGFKPTSTTSTSTGFGPVSGFAPTQATSSGFDPPPLGTTGFAFGSAAPSEPKPFNIFGFGTPTQGNGGGLFGFGSSASTAANNANPFASVSGSSQAVASQIVTSPVDASQSEAKPFLFGAPPTNDSKPIQFGFTTLSGGKDTAEKEKGEPVAKTPEVSDPFASLNAKTTGKDAQSASSAPTKDASGSPSTGGFLFGAPKEADKPPLFSFGVPQAAGDKTTEKPLFKFDLPTPSMTDSKPTRLPATTGNADEKVVSNAERTPMPTGGLFGNLPPPSSTPDTKPPPNIFAKPDAPSEATTSSFQPPPPPLFSSTTALPSSNLKTTQATAAPPLSTAAAEPAAAKEEDKIKETYGLDSIIKACESSKVLNRVKVIKPKFVEEFNATHESAPKAPVRHGILNHIRDVMVSIVDRTLSGETFTAPRCRPAKHAFETSCLLEHSKRRRLQSAQSPASDAYRSCQESDSAQHSPVASPFAPRSELGDGSASTVSRMCLSGFARENSLRDAPSHRPNEVIYLNRIGSTRFLMKAYVEHLVAGGTTRVVQPCYTCESCWPHDDGHFYNKLKLLAASSAAITKRLCRTMSFIIRHAAKATGALASYLRRRLIDPEAASEENDEHSEDSSNGFDAAVFTERLIRDLAISTKAGAVATGKYLAGVCGSSSRLVSLLADRYYRSMQRGASPLELLLHVTVEQLDSIVESTKTRLAETLCNQAPVHPLDVWATGVFWHVAFFDPLVLRRDLVPPSSGGEASDAVARELLRRSIDEYHASDYCLRLKQDVLHMAGFDVSAERLLLEPQGHRRTMVKCFSASSINHKPKRQAGAQHLPVTVSVSLNLHADEVDASQGLHLRLGTQWQTQPLLPNPKRRRGIEGQPLPGHLGATHRVNCQVRAISNQDPRLNNMPSIALYALSRPVFIGRPDLLNELFTSAVMPDLPAGGRHLCTTDLYGILSTLLRATGPELGGQYQTCLVCYRLSLSRLDLLSLYEFFNLSLSSSVSLCGCAEKNCEACGTRLRQTLAAVEERLLEEVIHYASGMSIAVDASLLRMRVVFACVGFELHHDPAQGGALQEEPAATRGRTRPDQDKAGATQSRRRTSAARIPRIPYADGFSRGIELAADATLRAQALLVLQSPFAIPDLHLFLTRLVRQTATAAEETPHDLPDMLAQSLESAISQVALHFPASHWDVYTGSEIRQEVEVAEGIGFNASKVSEYSKDSFLALLTLLRTAAISAGPRARREANPLGGADCGREDVGSHVARVLATVAVRSYQVPYAVGLYMASLGAGGAA